MELEELFQKINKVQYEPKNHKEALRLVLLNNKHFQTKNDIKWNLSLALPSLSFAFIILISTGTLPPPIPIMKTSTNQNTLYSRLSKNSNVIKADYGGGIKELQINQENTRMSLYFNKQNILIRSEIKK